MKRAVIIVGGCFFFVLSMFVYNDWRQMRKCSDCSYDIGFEQLVNSDIHGTERGFINLDENKHNETMFGLMEKGTWGTRFDYGNIKGRALCSSTGQGFFGYHGRTGNPDENSVGPNCWCKMMEPAVSRWVFLFTTERADDCIVNCARECSEDAKDGALFRSRLFRTVKN